MIVHLFNSSLVSGPETLAIPAFPDLEKELQTQIEVWNLAEIRKNDIAQVTLDYAKKLGLRTFEVLIHSRFDCAAVRSLASALESRKPTIVHAHDVKASTYLILAHLLLKFQKKKTPWKLVSTHHGIHARNGFLVRLYEWLYRFVFLWFFDRVLTVCSSDRTILRWQGLSAKKVLTHLNGVDRPLISRDQRMQAHQAVIERWQKDYSIDLKNKVILGVAARLSPEKNHELILAAFKKLKEKNRDWVCLCFGTGALEHELKKQTAIDGLDQLVYWCGYRKGLSNEMQGFDLLLSFSIGEGLPINLLEAGWAGTPVLATRVDGVNELLPKKDTRLHLSGLDDEVEPDEVAERILQLVLNVSIRAQLGYAFQKSVEQKFSGKAWKNRLKEIYRGL
jgi:glycosyltransferase involved in cell wall biosynthesis